MLSQLFSFPPLQVIKLKVLVFSFHYLQDLNPSGHRLEINREQDYSWVSFETLQEKHTRTWKQVISAPLSKWYNL